MGNNQPKSPIPASPTFIYTDVTLMPNGEVKFQPEVNALPSASSLPVADAPKLEASPRPGCSLEDFGTVVTFPFESQLEVVVTAKVRPVRRSKSAVDMGSKVKVETFHAFEQQCVGTHVKSMEDVNNGEGNETGEITQFMMENTIGFYLKKNGYKGFHRKLEFLVEGTDFFNIFSFLSQVSAAKEYPCLVTVPNWTAPYSSDLRQKMIDAAMETDFTLFGTKKTLRKGYLLNAAAKFSRPRVIKFLHNLIRRLVQGPSSSQGPSQLKYKIVPK